MSRFAPTRWDAYSYDAHIELWARVIQDHCDVKNGQQVVLIGHSMGCTYAQTLAAHSKAGQYRFDVSGIVAICPGLFLSSRAEKVALGTLCFIPESLFNFWREQDKKGGKDSGSVTRIAGDGADSQTRQLQLKFNDQSQTPVFRRTCWGILNATPVSAEHWAALPSSIPIQLIGGEHDPLTPVKQLHKIAVAIRANSPDRVLKTTILPGSHALPFDSNNYRSVAGIIESFLGDLDERLSLGWQLNYLATEGKWDVKNLEKWQAIEPVSEPIGKPVPIFRAMKTMREIDNVHSPKHFVDAWKDCIMAVIDISHDTPVYDPKALSEGGIEYHKFPTVSKYPPDENEVRDFILLVDKIRKDAGPKAEGMQVAVHCHYGFNRTGYFIAAYLVEKQGYGVQEAIDEFAEKRPPGIRHDHFLDTMFARYSRWMGDTARVTASDRSTGFPSGSRSGTMGDKGASTSAMIRRRLLV